MSMTTNYSGGNVDQGLAMVEVVFGLMQRIAALQAGVSRNLSGLDDLRNELFTMNRCLHDMSGANLPPLRGISPHDLADTCNALCGMVAEEIATVDDQLRFNREYGDFTLDLGTYCRSYRDVYAY